MSRRLQLQVILNAVDRATRPLRSIQQGSGRTAEALRASRDQLRQLENAQKNLGGFANLKRTSDNTARSLQQQQQRVRELTQQIRQTEGPTRQLNRQRDAAIRQAQRLKTRYQEEQQQLQTLRGRIREAGGSTRDLGGQQQQLANRIRTANEQMRTQQQRLDQVAQRQRRAADASRQYQRSMGNVGRVAGVGAGMMGAGVAKGYAAARLLAPGVAWSEQMSALQAVGRFSADDERYQALRAQSRDLGATTAFSATEVGSGQEFLLRAGMSAKAIQASMRDVLDLALANNTELGRTADIASNIGGAFKIDFEQEGSMTRVADILSGTASRANVDLEMLGDTMKYLGGAKDLNLTMEQAAAMAGLLGNIGIQGSQAGTTMRAMMNRLTNPAAKGAAAIENIGLQVADANGNMRAMPDILRDISTATADLGNVERKAILQDIFGAEAGSGMAELVNQMGDGALDELIHSLGESYGENAEMARTMADNIGGDLKNMRSAWEEIGNSITDTNEGPLRGLVQSVTEVLRGVGGWIKANPELAGTIAKVTGALIIITTVGGALTMMLASVLGPIVMLRYGLQLMAIHGGFLAKTALPAVAGALKALGAAVLAHPIIAIIAAIAAGAIYIWRNWETFGPKFAALWEGIKNIASNAWQGIRNMAGSAWQGITSVLGTAWQGITSMAASVWEGVTGIIGSAWDGLAVVAGGAWQGIRDAFSEGIGGVSRLLLDWSPLGLLWRGISTALGAMGIELPNTLSELGGAIINGLIGGITGGLGRLRDAITSMGSSIVGWLKDIASNAWQGVRDAFSEGIGGVSRLLLDWSPLGLLWRGISTALGAMGIELPNTLSELGGAIINGLIGGLTGGLDRLRETITSMGSSIVGWLKDIASNAWQGVREAFSEGIAGVSRLLLDWSPLGLLWRGISTALGAMGIELPNTLSELGGAIINGLIGGLTGGLDRLRETITGMGSSIVGWFKGVLGINSPSLIFQGFGGNLLEGLINGIDGKWSVLRDSISATASGVIGWFKDRLGIQSPSRVFAELGGHTMDGYQQGLARSESGPLREIDAFANRLRQAGAGLLLGGAALGASADASTIGGAGGVEFDTRPPLTTATAPAVTVQGDSIVLNVYPSAGMDEQALAQHIGRILEERDRQKMARARSAFHDLD